MILFIKKVHDIITSCSDIYRQISKGRTDIVLMNRKRIVLRTQIFGNYESNIDINLTIINLFDNYKSSYVFLEFKDMFSNTDFGRNIAFNRTDNLIAIGAPKATLNGKINAGLVCVYEYSGQTKIGKANIVELFKQEVPEDNKFLGSKFKFIINGEGQEILLIDDN